MLTIGRITYWQEGVTGVHSGGRSVIYNCLVLLGFRLAVILSRTAEQVRPVLQNRTFGMDISAPRFVQADVHSRSPNEQRQSTEEIQRNDIKHSIT